MQHPGGGGDARRRQEEKGDRPAAEEDDPERDRRTANRPGGHRGPGGRLWGGRPGRAGAAGAGES